MKKVLLLLTVIGSISAASASCDYSRAESANDLLDSIMNPRGQGCCSWHGGVAGCSMGHIVCSDGTMSGCGC